jgi:DNA-binding NtrC family response regulator
VTHHIAIRLQRNEPVILPLVGASQAMRDIARQVDAFAQSDIPAAMLVGEPGTGKRIIAEYIHDESSRAARPFAAVNCATVGAAMLRADLFGTTAISQTTTGLLEAARGGTIFIDEISEMADGLQTQLLRVLTDGAPARIIAAASKDLVNEVNSGRFGEKLYYQLSVSPLHLPPLRARSRDDLTELMMATFHSLIVTIPGAPSGMDAEAIDCLIGYPWPGNFRELHNAMETALLSARGAPVLQRGHLPSDLKSFAGSDDYRPRTIMDVERAHIHRTLRAHKLNRTHAARELGISRATLIKKIKEYGLVHRAADHE